MPQLKTPVTVRLNPELLAEVRESAARDNRSLTNFIETALRERIEVSSLRAQVRSPPARLVKDVKKREHSDKNSTA
jgi:hypothetical protein